MINQELINPESIVVVGGSNNLKKPGGKVVKNLVDGEFSGQLSVINPKENNVQDVQTFQSVAELDNTDLAIIAVAAKYCLPIIKELIETKNTKSFIMITAGFGEVNEEGRELELKIKEEIDKVSGCLIGPNCIGVLNLNYRGVFTTPIPKLHKDGCDLVSSSGATAVFIMEAGIPLGLKFRNVFSVGNAIQTSVEDVLEYFDETYEEGESSKIKLLYIENINDPQKFLKHASSLVNKGCKIAAIKSGSTEAGSRAASSHTGAIASSDMAVRALFRKAGVVYCSSREELITVASIFNYKELKGKNVAVITHAGGSAVMLTDALSKGGLEVPPIEGKEADELLSYLYSGSSVSNPIDFLATGTAEQLGIIIDYCEHKFDFIDAMVVVFGSPGLFDVENVYKVLSVKLDICKKPILPVLPSVINAEKEIEYFLSKGHVNFPDEVVLGNALAEVYNTTKPLNAVTEEVDLDREKIRAVIEEAEDGYLEGNQLNEIFDAAGIPRVADKVVENEQEAVTTANQLGYPVVMKVVGPVHKSDVGGVILNVKSDEVVVANFHQLMKIDGATGVLIQAMTKGVELFIGGVHEQSFGHAVYVGLGGIFIEVLKDVQSGLVPLNRKEVQYLLHQLKGYPLIKGVRGKEGVNEEIYTDVILRVSALLETAPEIVEMDINPLMGSMDSVVAVDARIRIEKNK